MAFCALKLSLTLVKINFSRLPVLGGRLRRVPGNGGHPLAALELHLRAGQEPGDHLLVLERGLQGPLRCRIRNL